MARKPATAVLEPPAATGAPVEATIHESGYLVPDVPIDSIDTAGNPRTDLGDLDELADSIREHGILEPPLVRPLEVAADGTVTRWDLLMGGRRLAAARLAGLSTVTVLVRSDYAQDARAEIARLVENLHRVDLTPLDEANAYDRLVREFKMKQADIAAQLGRNQGHISKRLSLLKLTANASALLTDGLMSIEAAVDVAKLPPALQSDVATRVRAGQTVDAVVRAAREKVSQLAERGRVIKALDAAKTPYIDRASDKKPLPEDVRKFYGEPEEFAADPGRLAVVLTEPRYWERADKRWIELYTNTPAEAEDEPAGAPRPMVSAEPGGGGLPLDLAIGLQASGSPASGGSTADPDREERVRAMAAARDARAARIAELDGFIGRLISGKQSPTWYGYLVHRSVIDGLLGTIAGEEGYPQDFAAAAEALGMPANEDLDAPQLPRLNHVLGLLAPVATGEDRLLRVALGSALLDAVSNLPAPDRSAWQWGDMLAGHALAFLATQGLELTESEQRAADAWYGLLVEHAVEFERVAARPDPIADELPDHDGAVEDGAVSEEVGEPTALIGEPVDQEHTGDDAGQVQTADGAVHTGVIPAEAAVQAEDPDGGFDAPVADHRPDYRAAASQVTAEEVGQITKRPALLALAGQLEVETTPRMTMPQLKAAIIAKLDPAHAIA